MSMPAQNLDRLLSRPLDRERLAALLARGWSLPSRGEHQLGRLQGRSLGETKLLVLLGPKNNVGARYFRLYLVDGGGRLSKLPLAEGLNNHGPFPAFNWLEFTRYNRQPEFDGERLDLTAQGQERRLFRMLGDLLPPGGHLMVEYESPGQQTTERILTLGYPPAASPIGSLLLAAGCLSFRDWYIPEGGREGPRKLQGFRAADEEHARRRGGEMLAALDAFLGDAARLREDLRELSTPLAEAARAELRTRYGE
jgi:hypothetical protein